MAYSKGRVREIRLGASEHTEVSIACPSAVIPQPGQYLLAINPADQQAVLSTPLFTIENTTQGFWASPVGPISWSPGTSVDLMGPLGHGFDLPGNFRRLGMIALGESVSRLLPLIHLVEKNHAAMTLFTDLNIPLLPSALEVAPLASLHDALDWPDYMVLDLPLHCLENLRSMLGLSGGEILPCLAQVLITTPMPCAGMGQCGACAIKSHRGQKLVCEDGPVFDLKSLSW